MKKGHFKNVQNEKSIVKPGKKINHDLDIFKSLTIYGLFYLIFLIFIFSLGKSINNYEKPIFCINIYYIYIYEIFD